MNCKVSADFPTPPLPTIITLWRAGCWFGFFILIQFTNWKGRKTNISLLTEERQDRKQLANGKFKNNNKRKTKHMTMN